MTVRDTHNFIICSHKSVGKICTRLHYLYIHFISIYLNWYIYVYNMPLKRKAKLYIVRGLKVVYYIYLYTYLYNIKSCFTYINFIIRFQILNLHCIYILHTVLFHSAMFKLKYIYILFASSVCITLQNNNNKKKDIYSL